MGRPSRGLWLPAVAVMLPCAVIGVLGHQWLALEREAAGRRGIDAAQAAVAALRRDLAGHLQKTGDAAARSLDEFRAERPPFHPVPRFPPMIGDAYLFDSSGAPLAPDYEARDRVMATARDSTREAASLLARSRAALTTGQLDTADQYAARIAVCCPAARDEYGVSFALYAAWQRVVVAERSAARASRLAALAREIRDLIDRGYLGRSDDEEEIALIARKAGGLADITALVAAVNRVRATVDHQIETTRIVGGWLAGVEPPSASAPRFGTFGRGPAPSVAAAVRVPGNRTVVMLLDVESIASWIAAWAGAHAAFEMTLMRSDPHPPSAVLETPLVPEVSALTLVVRPRAADPLAERRRERLFAGAVVAALILTLLIGYLAMRDVSRELRTAALRSTFVASVSHELKTPLASIRLLAETLRWGRARPERSAELLDTIVQESDRLGRLVDNVLTSSRIESGARVYEPRVISLSDAVHDAVRRFDYVLKNEGFALVEQLDDEAIEVRADPDALGRTILNLLGNAVKYSGTSRQIRVALARRDGRAELRVADEGFGIAPHEQARVFETFYRSPDAAAQTTGAGLGLALVRHFAESHGGRIAVSSELGRGSVFCLSLPLVVRTGHEDGADLDR